jgi:hypothetical protein
MIPTNLVLTARPTVVACSNSHDFEIRTVNNLWPLRPLLLLSLQLTNLRLSSLQLPPLVSTIRRFLGRRCWLLLLSFNFNFRLCICFYSSIVAFRGLRFFVSHVVGATTMRLLLFFLEESTS